MNNIFIPKGRMADDEILKRKREELKRKILNGERLRLEPDWKTIFENLLQNRERYLLPSEISIAKFKSKISSVLFDPHSRPLTTPWIPNPGARDDDIYKKNKNLLESFEVSFSLINLTYSHLLYIVNDREYRKQLGESATKFQFCLIHFFYNNISVDFANAHEEFYKQDFERFVDFEINISGIKYKQYDYKVSEDFIRRIFRFVFGIPNSIIGKFVFWQKINSLNAQYENWKKENKEILEKSIDIIYYNHI